jgi:hypothetical protein
MSLALFLLIADNGFLTARLFPDKTLENRGADFDKDKFASHFREKTHC